MLGIDFVERIGVVLDLAQRTWHFKDEPKQILPFNKMPNTLPKSLIISQTVIIESHEQNVQKFLSNFPNNNNSNNDYSEEGIYAIFQDCLPDSYKPPQKETILFPPLKKKIKEVPVIPEKPDVGQVKTNSIEIHLRNNEAQSLNNVERDDLNKLITRFDHIFENISKPIQGIEHHINTMVQVQLCLTEFIQH